MNKQHVFFMLVMNLDLSCMHSVSVFGHEAYMETVVMSEHGEHL